MDQKTEKEIIARISDGDSGAYALLVDEYKKPIYNLALRMTGSLPDADELAQEIFLRAYRKIGRFDPQKSFFTWLYTIGINLIRNYLKKKRRDDAQKAAESAFEEEQAAERSNGERHILDEEKIGNLEKALFRLPVDLREAVILRYHLGLSFEDIAVIEAISISAVKMRVYRGLDRLKKLLDE